MILIREELRVLLAVIQRPFQSWRQIEPACGLHKPRARIVRDRLLAIHALRLERRTIPDASGRRYKRTLYDVNPNLSEVRELRAWVESGQAAPLALLAPVRLAKQAIQRLPGIHADATDRVLEAILRNPNQPWRIIRTVARCPGKIADVARNELYDNAHITPGFEERPTRNGRGRIVPRWVPNEESPLVRELRKRYGLAIPIPPAKIVLGEPITTSEDLLASVRFVLAKDQSS